MISCTDQHNAAISKPDKRWLQNGLLPAVLTHQKLCLQAETREISPSMPTKTNYQQNTWNSPRRIATIYSTKLSLGNAHKHWCALVQIDFCVQSALLETRHFDWRLCRLRCISMSVHLALSKNWHSGCVLIGLGRRHQHCILVAAFYVFDDLPQHAVLSLKGLHPLPQLGKLWILIMHFLFNCAHVRLLALTCLLSWHTIPQKPARPMIILSQSHSVANCGTIMQIVWYVVGIWVWGDLKIWTA